MIKKADKPLWQDVRFFNAGRVKPATCIQQMLFFVMHALGLA